MQITDEGVAHISSMRSLMKLDVSGCCWITDVGVAHINTMTSLKFLHVRNCFCITDIDIFTSLKERGVAVLTR